MFAASAHLASVYCKLMIEWPAAVTADEARRYGDAEDHDSWTLLALSGVERAFVCTERVPKRERLRYRAGCVRMVCEDRARARYRGVRG